MINDIFAEFVKLERVFDMIDYIHDELKIIGANAKNLYGECCAIVDITNPLFLAPANWLLCQNTIRREFEKKTSTGKFASEELDDLMSIDCFSKYMNYMYKSYPPHFVEKTLEYKNLNNNGDNEPDDYRFVDDMTVEIFYNAKREYYQKIKPKYGSELWLKKERFFLDEEKYQLKQYIKKLDNDIEYVNHKCL